MIEENNKFLVFKYSTGVAVIEIAIKEMPYSLSIAYLIKVGRMIIMKFHDETEEGVLSEDYWKIFVCGTP